MSIQLHDKVLFDGKEAVITALVRNLSFELIEVDLYVYETQEKYEDVPISDIELINRQL